MPAKPDNSQVHSPVLLKEVISLLAPRPGERFLDGTLGAGGHSYALLASGAEVTGIDQDAEILEVARGRLKEWGDGVSILQGNTRNFPDILSDTPPCFDGMLYDCGISSLQLDRPVRGFSFRENGPLDMRMDPTSGRSAADLVNQAECGELERIFRELGEERHARRVARVIARRRESEPFATTLDLANCVAQAIPDRRAKRHPATRIFQALRMELNDELGALKDILAHSVQWLRPGGRLAVISFHSLEDRIVKRFMRLHSVETVDDPTWPAPRPNPECYFRRLTKKPVTPQAQERESNPRSRSARLRVAQRLAS